MLAHVFFNQSLFKVICEHNVQLLVVLREQQQALYNLQLGLACLEAPHRVNFFFL